MPQQNDWGKAYEFTITVSQIRFSDGTGHEPHRMAQQMRRQLHAAVARYLSLPENTRSTVIKTEMRRVP